MTHDPWNTLWEEARTLHSAVSDLSTFCPFPEVEHLAGFTEQVDPLCNVMISDTSLDYSPFPGFRDACLALGPHALWRGTYRDTAIGEALHAHFGTFEVLGRDTALQTNTMRGFMIYQRPGYHYPLHHHPAEELYLVIAGAAQFEVEGAPSRWLIPGQTAYHASNLPHALTTKDQPILAYVLWRGDITTKPVFTYPDSLT